MSNQLQTNRSTTKRKISFEEFLQIVSDIEESNKYPIGHKNRLSRKYFAETYGLNYYMYSSIRCGKATYWMEANKRGIDYSPSELLTSDTPRLADVLLNIRLGFLNHIRLSRKVDSEVIELERQRAMHEHDLIKSKPKRLWNAIAWERIQNLGFLNYQTLEQEILLKVAKEKDLLTYLKKENRKIQKAAWKQANKFETKASK